MKYTKELLEPLVKKSSSVMEVLRFLGTKCSGGSHAHISQKIKFFGIDTSHFTGSIHNRNKEANNKKTWQEILVKRDSHIRQAAWKLRRALIESGRKYVCECGLLPMWNGKELRFQVDHINQDWSDDRPENLRFLCPNCHSQTKGHSGSKGLTDLTSINRFARVNRRRKKLLIDVNSQ